MTYATGEALLLTAIQKLSDYDSTNSGRGNFLILNRGNSANYIILRPGEFEVSVVSLGGLGANATSTEHTTWITEVMVYRRYIDDYNTLTQLEADVATVIAQIQKWRQLGDTTNGVIVARVMGGTAAEIIRHDPDGPFWLRQTVRVVWNEERTITYAE